MKWNILIPFSEKGNNLPLVLLFIVKRRYDSGLFCSSVTIKGMCCEWLFLPCVVSYDVAIFSPHLRSCTSRPTVGGGAAVWCADQGWALAVQEPVPQRPVLYKEQSRAGAGWAGGHSVKHRLLEPVISAQEALTLEASLRDRK